MRSWPPTEPLEAVVTQGDARLSVDLRGGGLRELTVGGWQVLDGYPSGSVPHGRRGGVLLPWPNRIRDGRWQWHGQVLQLEVASPENPVASHGLVSWQPWAVLATDDDAVTVGTVIEPRPGYPFRLAAAVDYLLAADRLIVTVRVRNAGREAAPFGAGMHPYLSVGTGQEGSVRDVELTVPARTALDLERGLPTGGTHPFDGDVGRIGERAFDDALTDLVRDDDGRARARLRGPGGSLTLAVDGAWRWMQVFTGDSLRPGERRRSVAIEPMTCPPNALADGVDLVVLDPGADWAATWDLTWSPAA
jgi:aldose 1-epimerase